MTKDYKHPPYFAIKGYAIIHKKTENECARAIGVSLRTYHAKIKGDSDFSATEMTTLSDFIGEPIANLFVT